MQSMALSGQVFTTLEYSSQNKAAGWLLLTVLETMGKKKLRASIPIPRPAQSLQQLMR